MRREVEIAVGVFMLAGVLALGYLSIRLGQVDLSAPAVRRRRLPDGRRLKTGSVVEIAGSG